MPKKSSKKLTPRFREKVYSVVKKIPRGKVLTYKQVAKIAGSPKAYRAVGNIMHNNPDLENIPCHRVVRSDGRAGGYRDGRAKKIKILKSEGVFLR